MQPSPPHGEAPVTKPKPKQKPKPRTWKRWAVIVGGLRGNVLGVYRNKSVAMEHCEECVAYRFMARIARVTITEERP